MTRTRLRVFTVTALLSLAGAVLGDGLQDKTLQDIAAYREWTRLTPKPILVELPSGTFSIGTGDIGG